MDKPQPPDRSRNAKAQARHRAKRKAYIEQLEKTVASLKAAVDGDNPGSSSTRIQNLTEENERLKAEIQSLRAQIDLLSTSSPSSATMLDDIPGKRRRMSPPDTKPYLGPTIAPRESSSSMSGLNIHSTHSPTMASSSRPLDSSSNMSLHHPLRLQIQQQHYDQRPPSSESSSSGSHHHPHHPSSADAGRSHRSSASIHGPGSAQLQSPAVPSPMFSSHHNLTTHRASSSPMYPSSFGMISPHIASPDIPQHHSTGSSYVLGQPRTLDMNSSTANRSVSNNNNNSAEGSSNMVRSDLPSFSSFSFQYPLPIEENSSFTQPHSSSFSRSSLPSTPASPCAFPLTTAQSITSPSTTSVSTTPCSISPLTPALSVIGGASPRSIIKPEPSSMNIIPPWTPNGVDHRHHLDSIGSVELDDPPMMAPKSNLLLPSLPLTIWSNPSSLPGNGTRF